MRLTHPGHPGSVRPAAELITTDCQSEPELLYEPSVFSHVVHWIFGVKEEIDFYFPINIHSRAAGQNHLHQLSESQQDLHEPTESYNICRTQNITKTPCNSENIQHTRRFWFPFSLFQFSEGILGSGPVCLCFICCGWFQHQYHHRLVEGNCKDTDCDEGRCCRTGASLIYLPVREPNQRPGLRSGAGFLLRSQKEKSGEPFCAFSYFSSSVFFRVLVHVKGVKS